ncbi:hypothetical protein O9K51_00122 [Purpureocillium lavendulum]|uniref:Uncharacterized protein n=1 Tax=Purpureocillium lavendulum TaxID=1247861 RepID=A0AB34G118_9HYPO|nr:hypothetical protein O9K51_00122 [Purpureocillium lavendulum]
MLLPVHHSLVGRHMNPWDGLRQPPTRRAESSAGESDTKAAGKLPSPDPTITTAYEAQRRAGVMKIVRRPNSEKTLDIMWIQIDSEEERAKIERELADDFAPGLKIYHASQTPHPFSPFVDPDAWRASPRQYIVSIPFEYAERAGKILRAVQFQHCKPYAFDGF